MKKLLFTLAAIATAVTASAQVMQAYHAGVSVGTYSPIESPTYITQGTAAIPADFDDVASKTAFFSEGIITSTSTVTGIPIGFTFKYGDLDATRFGVSPSGYLIFTGDDAVEFNPTRSRYIFTTMSSCDNVAGMVLTSTRLVDDSYIAYSVEGEAGERVLNVEISGIEASADAWAWSGSIYTPVSLKYTISEADNSITLVTKGMTGFEETGYCSVGLKQQYGNTLYMATADDDDSWLTAYTSTSSENLQFGPDCGAVDGFTFKFEYPSACATPQAQPTDLQAAIGTDYITGSFTAAEDGPDQYLVVITPGAAVGFVPQDGVTYAEDSQEGESTIVVFTSDLEFDAEGLDASTQYTISIFSANTLGTNGPAYLLDNPLSLTFTTMPAAPAALNVIGSTTSSIEFSVEANAAGNNVMVLLTSQVAETGLGWNTAPNFGDPEGAYQVGDVIEDTEARVVWIGSSSESVVVDDLASGTGWYLCAYSVDSEGTGYSTDVLEARVATVATMPYIPDLENTVYPELPVGWESEEFTRSDMEIDGNEVYILQAMGIEGYEDEPASASFTTIPVVVDQRNGSFSLDWCWQVSSGFAWFASWTPMTFVEGDQIDMLISEDGENWTAVRTVNSSNAPAVDPDGESFVWNHMECDLSDYVGKTLWLRFNGTTVQAGSAGTRLYVKDIAVEGLPIPVVPEVRIDEVSYDYAIVTWRGEQASYQIEWGEEDDADDALNTATVDVKTFTIEDLVANTNYKVRVRGLAESEEDYSAWSDFVTFTTADWPAVEAPTDLQSFTEEEYPTTVVLSWSEDDEYLTFDLRYRKGSETSWNTIEGLEDANYTLTGLEPGTKYLWTVKAHCTHDRETSWATQAEFTTPEASALVMAASGLSISANGSAITAVSASGAILSIEVYDMGGRLVASNDALAASTLTVKVPAAGNYIVKVTTAAGNAVYKVAVK